MGDVAWAQEGEVRQLLEGGGADVADAAKTGEKVALFFGTNPRNVLELGVEKAFALDGAVEGEDRFVGGISYGL